MKLVLTMVLMVAAVVVGGMFADAISQGYSFGGCPVLATNCQEMALFGVRMAQQSAPMAQQSAPRESSPSTPASERGDRTKCESPEAGQWVKENACRELATEEQMRANHELDGEVNSR